MRVLVFVFFMLSGASSALADAIAVDFAWARATPPGARTGAVYLTLNNSGSADQLLAVSTDVADRAQLHTHVHEDGMMRMEQVEAVKVPEGGQAVLEPHGKHIMLMGLKAALKPGERVNLRLEFGAHPPLEIEVPVKDSRR